MTTPLPRQLGVTVSTVLFSNVLHANLRVAAGQRLQHHLVVRLPRLLAHNVSVCQRHDGRSVVRAGEAARPGGRDGLDSIGRHNICTNIVQYVVFSLATPAQDRIF